jgi:ribosomal protein L15
MDHPTKILGSGDVKHPLLVSADRFSSSAEKKIVAAGGSIKQA